MKNQTIKKIIKYETIGVFALYAFAGGSNAFAAITMSMTPSTPVSFIYWGLSVSTPNLSQWCDDNGADSSDIMNLDYYGMSLYRCESSSGHPRYPNGRRFLVGDMSNFTFTLAGFDDIINPDETAYLTQPSLAQCETNTPDGYRKPKNSLSTNTIYIEGCIYTSSGVTACIPETNSEFAYCSANLIATGTYNPSDPDAPQTEFPTSTQTETPTYNFTEEQYQLQNQISDIFGAEPLEISGNSQGTRFLDYKSSTGCELGVAIAADGTINKHTDTCNVLDTSDIETPVAQAPENNTNPDGSPNSGGGSGSQGGSGNTSGNPTGSTPTTRPTAPTIDTTDTPETTCDPLTQDCGSENTGLLSDIKELLSFNDVTGISNAADNYDQNLSDVVEQLETVGSQQIDIDGFNIGELVRDILNLPDRLPIRQDLVFTANTSFGEKELRIENMYEKTELMRILLAWAFFMYTCYSCYQIVFERPLLG